MNEHVAIPLDEFHREVEEYYSTFYIGVPNPYSDPDIASKVHSHITRLEEWLPKNVKTLVDKVYWESLDSVVRYINLSGLDIDISRREIYVLSFSVVRSILKSGLTTKRAELAIYIVPKLYILRRGIYAHLLLNEVRLVKNLYIESMKLFVQRAVERMSLGNPRIQRTLGASYMWFRSNKVNTFSSIQCSAKITSIILNTPYAHMIKRVYIKRSEPRAYIHIFKRLGIEVVTKPPYTVIEKITIPSTLCTRLSKVVDLPSFVVCRQ